MTDPAMPLAGYAARLRWEDVPAADAAFALDLLVDSFAAALAGAGADGIDAVLELHRAWGGAPQSTVWGTAERLPDIAAAFLNSALLHARDFDDTDDQVPFHSAVAVLPAVLAVAEAEGATGADLLAGFVAGIEVAIRFGRAGRTGAQKGFNITGLCSGMGAAAGAARALGLPPEGVVRALGHQLNQTGGTIQTIVDGALAKRLTPALMSRAAVLSARLAQRGVTAPVQVVEGRFGYANLFQEGDLDADALIEGLGDEYHLRTLSLKPYPSCRFTHPVIDGALALAAAGVRPDDVAALDVGVSRLAKEMVGRSYPAAAATVVDAQFSAPYTAAVALATGQVELSDFTAAAVRRADIAALAARVRVEVDPALAPTAVAPVRLEARLAGGRRELTVDALSGSPERPLTREELRRKLERCIVFGDHVTVDADEVVAAVAGLEDAVSVDALIGALSGVAVPSPRTP